MQLISRLQDELDLEVQFADLVDKKTIGDLDAYIQVQVSNPGMFVGVWREQRKKKKLTSKSTTKIKNHTRQACETPACDYAYSARRKHMPHGPSKLRSGTHLAR
jgi:hypothetical protein